MDSSGGVMDVLKPPTFDGPSIKNQTKTWLLQNIFNIKEMNWGTRVLILDAVTMLVIDATIDMSEITRAGVCDIARIDNQRIALNQLHGIYFITPTNENIDLIIGDFVHGDEYKYKRIHIYFTAQPNKEQLKKLAMSQACARIETCKVAPLNYLVYDSHSFHFGTPKSFFNLHSQNVAKVVFEQECQDIGAKISSVCAVLGECPIIRYAANSPMARSIATALQANLDECVNSKQIEKAAQRGQILIIDRSHDLISPVIHDFFYQALAGDILHLKNDVYSYEYDNKDTGQKENVQAILNENDPVFVQIRHLHVQAAQNHLVTQIKTFTTETDKLKASKDVSRLARAMPHYLLMRGKYAMHQRILKRCLDAYMPLKPVVEAEQSLATGLDEKNNKCSVPADLRELLNSNAVPASDRLRLVMLLYVCEPRCMNDRHTWEAGFDQQSMVALNEWCRIVSQASRRDQRREPQEVVKWKTTRYCSFVHDTYQLMVDGKLSPKDYPFLNASEAGTLSYTSHSSKRASCRPGFGGSGASKGGAVAPYLYIFIAGGITHAEIREAHLLSLELGREVILGSTHVIDALGFLEQLGGLTSNANNPVYQSSFIH